MGHELSLEPQHAVAEALKLALPARIPTADGLIVRPINLNDELPRWSQEVDDEPVGDNRASAYTAGVEPNGSRIPTSAFSRASPAPPILFTMKLAFGKPA
jgi:hypothetical protein